MNLNNSKEFNDYLLRIYKDQYLKQIPIYNTLHTNYKYKYSSIHRILKMINMMTTIDSNKTKMICTVLKINRHNNILNYAYIYGYLIKDEISNIYILNSPSLISKDGEYRHRFIKYNILDIIKNNKIMEYFYNYLANEFKNKEYSFDCEIFNLYDQDILNKYKKKFINSNILLNIYLISWLTEIFNIYNKNQEINLNESINGILFSNKDINIFSEYYKNNKETIEDIIKQFVYYNNELKLEMGQKLIPFNYIQLKEYKNIIHPQWKELLINKIINNLIYNINSPCFAIFNDWLLITNSNRNLFDNEIIFNKLFYSDNIKSSLNYLYLVKNNLISIDNKDNKIIPEIIKNLKKLISLSEDTLLMSNISICYLSEYSGKTLYDYLNKIVDNNKINKFIGNIYNDHDIFKKYIFEIIYSLYCLNIKGVIHGDLHLNNITLNIQKYSNCCNNNVVYNINKENVNKTFIFKHYGCYPCIIDFSRSYIYLNSIDEDIIEKEKNKIRNKFISSEKKRIITELNKIFPNYIKNHYHKIKFLLKNTNFEILFKYFSAYDTFIVCTNLLIFLKRFSIQKNININEQNILLLNNISKRAYNYLEQIIIQENYNSSKTHEFPNYLLLEEFFKDNLLVNNELKNKDIIDIFSTYNIQEFKNIKQMKFEIYKTINNNLNLDNDIDDKIKKNIINYYKLLDKNTENEKLDIEKIVNNEYYKIKSNLLIASESLSTKTSSLIETTNSLSFHNI